MNSEHKVQIKKLIIQLLDECLESGEFEEFRKRKVFNLAQASKFLNRTPMTLYNWVKAGCIPAMRMKGCRGLYFYYDDLQSLYTKVQFKYRN
jgi:hypothetical protein